MISWESRERQEARTAVNPCDLESIAAGEYDDLITDYAALVSRVCGRSEVLIRFNHEMELQPGHVPWYPWQGQPEAYVRAWQHVVDVFKLHAPHARFVWSPNRFTEGTNAYYPGDEYVDYVSMTMNSPVEARGTYRDVDDFCQRNNDTESYGKKILIAEAAVDAVDSGVKRRWIESAFDLVADNDQLLGLVWFNIELPPNDYRVDSSPETYEQFKKRSGMLRDEAQ